LIQTTQPSHPVLQYVQQHDYKRMYADEIEKRKQFAYPPFSRLIHLSFKHKIREVVERAAHEFASALKNKYGSYIVGPAEPVINRVRNQYRMELLLKLPRDTKTIAQCKRDVIEQVAILHQHKSYKAVGIVPDVDGV
ncbi:MAG TPA: primosomal protein N', partial [Chitinophagaceae bacterium]